MKRKRILMYPLRDLKWFYDQDNTPILDPDLLKTKRKMPKPTLLVFYTRYIILKVLAFVLTVVTGLMFLCCYYILGYISASLLIVAIFGSYFYSNWYHSNITGVESAVAIATAFQQLEKEKLEQSDAK